MRVRYLNNLTFTSRFAIITPPPEAPEPLKEGGHQADCNSEGHPVRFTHRESEILALVARGYSDKQIASELRLSRHTIRSHFDRLLRRNGLSNRAAAAVAWSELCQSVDVPSLRL